jgi:hypothetical protein
MATQNRGLCEALKLNKEVYASRINAHIEIGLKAGLNINSFFYPLETINLTRSILKPIYSTEFLELEQFTSAIDTLLGHGN